MKNTMIILGMMGLMAGSPLMADVKAPAMEIREDFGSVSSFCRDRLMTLKRAYHQAEIESQQGNHSLSMNILEAALKTANSNISSRYANTLTSKAIRRGVILLENLKRTDESRQKLRTINHFLFNYFLFIESVSNRLDIPYFQVNNGGFSRISASNTQFEKLFVNFAGEQVSMVLNTMSTEAREGRGSIIYPIGSPTLLLTALKVTTRAMANDLSESIFAANYACTIQELDLISADIDLYLTSRTSYADEFIAVQELVGQVKRATQGRRSCGNAGDYGNNQSESRTTDALSRSITLHAGTTEQVRLNGGRYIKKLIISAEGIRNDAMFDVVVNGDVKGTVYVPGRDPSYFVTIEDYADSIELVSRNGNAIISRILVIAE